jgi:uncharacterized protein YkwD
MDQKPMPEIVRQRITPKFGLAIALVIAGLLATWAPSALACQGGRLPTSRLTVDQARLTVTCLINGNRARHHVKPVYANLPLGVAAQTHTDAMVAQNFFSHGGDGTPASRAANAGYMIGASSWGVGEDLFWGAGSLSSPRATVHAWMTSTEHRSVLLSKSFRQIGVGVDQGSPAGADNPGTGTYTALFGFRHAH